MLSLQVTFACCALLFAVAAARSDLLTRKIPNKYTFSVFAFALVARSILSLIYAQWNIVGDALLGSVIGFIVLFPFFVIRQAGAGDVKLLAAMGMLLGWKSFLWLFVITAFVDGGLLVFANLKAAYHFVLIPLPLKDKIQDLKQLSACKRNKKNPYALPIAIACCVLLALLLLPNPIVAMLSELYPEFSGQFFF